MKPYRIFLMILIFLTILCLAPGCGNKYSDVNKMNEKFVDLMESYVEDLNKSDNAKEVAKAINRYADSLEDLWPKMQQLSEKYPELKDNNSLPEELKASQKSAEEVGKKMAGAMMKIMPYMRDPEVQKAQQRLGAVMTKK